MEILELLRLLRLGSSDRTIADLLQVNRRTVARYRRWANQQGLLTGELPTAGALQQLVRATLPTPLPPQQTSSLEPYREEIIAYRARGLELAAIRARLEEVHQHPVSYSAVWRLVQRLEPRTPTTYVRVEGKPGDEAQVDFGSAGLQIDPTTGQLRKSWVFVMVLAWSRHLYAEIVFDQRLETWLLCHRHAFEYFGGVPARVVLDNLKSAIVCAAVHEPTAQRAYRECAEHYGFLIDPNPPRAPHLKGKVEQGGVHYVKRNFLAGREPEPVDALNGKLRHWCMQVAGQRRHGTTQQVPLERFRQVEQGALLPLPRSPYDLAVWAKLRLHRDCHVTFDRCYYSAPYRLVGQDLWVRGGTRTVEIYTTAHELVATHDRAPTPGTRQTNLAHLPPEKVPGLVLNRADCQAQAEAIGPATAAIVQRLLAHRPEDRLKVAGRLLRLAGQYSPERLELACARACYFGAGDYVGVKRILQAGLEQQPLAASPAPPVAAADGVRYTFVRSASEFVAGLLGGGR